MDAGFKGNLGCAIAADAWSGLKKAAACSVTEQVCLLLLPIYLIL